MSPRPPNRRYAKIRNAGELEDLAREALGPVEDPVTPPAPVGRDPTVHRTGDKVKFFRGDWREAWPQYFKVHRPDGAA